MKAVISNGGGLGNVLHTIPLARAISEMLGSAPHLACKAEWHGAFDDQPMFGGLCVGFQRNDFDAIFHLALAGGFVEFKDCGDGLWKRAMPRQESQFSRHETEAYMTGARTLGWDCPTPSHLLEMPDALYQPELPVPFIAFGTRSAEVAGWGRKNWPEEYWEELARRVPVTPVFLGPKSSSRPWMREYGIDLCGATTVKQARDILWKAQQFVGPDCGLSHLAACCGIHVTAIFGPTCAVKNRPSGPRSTVLQSDLPCVPCQRDRRTWSRCRDWKCMREITPEMVLASMFSEVE